MPKYNYNIKVQLIGLFLHNYLIQLGESKKYFAF